MLKRMWAHHLFLRTSGAQLALDTGNPHILDRTVVRSARMLGPWFLIASLALLVLNFRWISLLFAPLFVAGYFLFSLRSAKDGGIIFPAVLAVMGNLLP
ncbi:MAG TPA: hypothetical protein VLM37_05300, partial [Fibrobacteraceae bacterium]|nr:hypothetical protein [Fibrobacteraceae bacterium]